MSAAMQRPFVTRRAGLPLSPSRPRVLLADPQGLIQEGRSSVELVRFAVDSGMLDRRPHAGAA